MPSKSYKKNNYPKNNIVKQLIFTFIALFLFVLILIPVIENVKEIKAVDREIAEMKKEEEKLENSNKELKEMLKYLESEESLVARGREDLGLKKPNEKVAIIKDENETNDIINNNNFKKELSNPRIWFRYFFQ